MQRCDKLMHPHLTHLERHEVLPCPIVSRQETDTADTADTPGEERRGEGKGRERDWERGRKGEREREGLAVPSSRTPLVKHVFVLLQVFLVRLMSSSDLGDDRVRGGGGGR